MNQKDEAKVNQEHRKQQTRRQEDAMHHLLKRLTPLMSFGASADRTLVWKHNVTKAKLIAAAVQISWSCEGNLKITKSETWYMIESSSHSWTRLQPTLVCRLHIANLETPPLGGYRPDHHTISLREHDICQHHWIRIELLSTLLN